MKIFEISFGKTGTSSLTKAMRILGYRTLHGWGTAYDQQSLQELINGQLPSCIDHYDFISDIAAPFYQELDEAYPGSKFILLVRDEQAWLKSLMNHARTKNFQPCMNYLTFYRMVKFGCFWSQKNPRRALRANREHQRAVKDYFRSRPDDLLVIDICGGAAWEPLCEFLGKPVPAVPFPHENRGQYAPQTADDPRRTQTVVVGSHPGRSQAVGIEETKPLRRVDKPRILFASYHCYIDPSSGAAVSTRGMMEMLAARGWPVRVFCGSKLDHGPAERIEQVVSDLQIPFERKGGLSTENAEAVLHCSVEHVDVSIYCAADRERLTRRDGDNFLALYERLLDRWKPDVLMTYGGRPLHPLMMLAARRRGIRVVFSLRNLSYSEAELFQPADAVLVPSQFSAEYYHRHLGLNCTPIPSPIDWSRVQCERDPTRRFVTFVNPQRTKGVQIFARIAVELWRRRPDIPLLVVESRGGAKELEKLPIDLSGCKNLHRMANTPDPRDFYRVSHIVLMPSLCMEGFARVSVESIISGIPVLASDRGALPEVISEAGFFIPIPARHTPRSQDVATVDEVEPWITRIIELWDDEALYNKISRRSRQAAEAYREERVAEQYAAFFRQVANLPLQAR